MKHSEIRQKFLDYFSSHDHTVIPSSSLVPPPTDESVLLTTAGMQQLKPYFLGEADALADFGNLRLTSIQKCFRTSDILEVGDESHLTFFEMLGNFSIGDYFKETAIPLAWNFLTEQLKLDPKRMFVSVFAGESGISRDAQAIEIWEREVPGIKIREQGREDNFWGPPGKIGPCGPSSEIHYILPNGQELELWNLVFTEFFKDDEGRFTKLKAQNIDTGMGLDRLASILQKKDNVFETDLFVPILDSISKLAGVGEENGSRQSEERLRSLRIVGDHVRGAVFLVGDGVVPLNLGRGYVLRRILRRAVLHGRLLDINGYFLAEPVREVIALYKKFYPELGKKEKEIQQIIEDEEKKFSQTLNRGLKELEKMGKNVDAFALYDTYGFPLELTQELAQSRGLKVNTADFEKKLEEQKERARSAAKKREGAKDKIAPQHTAAHLLNAALKQILGPSVRQAGQHLEEDKFRHDFTFGRKLTAEEIKQVEDLVKEKIKENLSVKRVVTTYDKAKEMGAEAWFKEKYEREQEISLYHVGDDPKSAFSKELCGGPHVTATGKIGDFAIIKEESAGAGVRRIYGQALPK